MRERSPLPPMTESLAGLAEVLTWRGRISHTLWLQPYEAQLGRYLAELATKPGADPTWRSAITMISRHQNYNIFRNPLISEQLILFNETGEVDSALLSKLFLACLVEVGDIEAPEIELWSPRGDRIISGPVISSACSERNVIGGTSAVIDFNSPYVRDSEFGIKLDMLEERESYEFRNKLSAALSFLNATSTNAFSFWNSAIDVLTIRKRNSGGRGLFSNTNARRPRNILIFDPNLDTIDHFRLAEGLLHEAIHSVLFTFERTVGPFIAEEMNHSDRTAVSPWSGRNLSLISYVHACVVWFGLYWLWTNAMSKNDHVEMHRVEATRIARGFALRPFSVGLSHHIDALSPDISDLLYYIEDTMVRVRV